MCTWSIWVISTYVYKLTNRQPVVKPTSLSEISGSSRYLLQVFDPNIKEIPETWSAFYIDVRDMAEVHVRAAAAPPSAGNQRYLIAGPGVGTYKMVLSVTFSFNLIQARKFLVEHYPNEFFAPLSKEAEEEEYKQTYDSSKAQETFGMKFRSYEELLGDYADFAISLEK